MLFIIPSLSREDILLKKTLPLLLSTYHVAPERIHVFVIQKEYASYVERIGAISPQVQVHIGPLGLHHMRNHIHSFFPEGTEMVCLDDDITEIQQLYIREEITDVKSAKRYGLVSLTAETFDRWLQDAFHELHTRHLSLFGIYPVRNGYFMKDLPSKTFDLRFIVGCVWGCINRHHRTIVLEEKEDVERTLLSYIQDKGVLRYNHLCPVTKYYKEQGGMQARTKDRKETSQQSCCYLLTTYPMYCKLYTSKKSGIHEIRLLTKSSSD